MPDSIPPLPASTPPAYFAPKTSIPTAGTSVEPWQAAQAAAIAAAEAIAATAAAEAAAEAAAAAQQAVDTASAVAVQAAAKAVEVAARAMTAAAAAADEVAAAQTVERLLTADCRPGSLVTHARSGSTQAAELLSDLDLAAQVGACEAASAVAKVACSVATVAAVAAEAVVAAAKLIGEQLSKDAVAAATAVRLANEEHVIQSGPTDLADVAAHHLSGRAAGSELRLADDLRLGISTSQLRLQFQPIVELATGLPVSVEALVRWQHPERGFLAPQEFIELAERTGLVLPLGEWVLHEACRVAVRLQARQDVPLTVAVNLSAKQLSAGDIADLVAKTLDMHGCRGDSLAFEITETGLVTDMAAAIRSLRGLRELGAGLAIDDFGTGHATLQYLSQLPVDVLKIDRSFVSALGSSVHDTAMVASIISLAHNVNVQCVAEGVETEPQRVLLQQLGCDFVQGYLVSHPMDESELHGWLDDQLSVPSRRDAPLPRTSPETARILAMGQAGTSPATIAAILNIDGSRTAEQRRWSDRSVAHVIARAARVAVPLTR